jgi:hypothetical protein
MNFKPVVAFALLAASGATLANPVLPAVAVHADPANQLTIACAAPSLPSRAEVVSLLNINDSTQATRLRNKLMIAASDACSAGASKIVVVRGANGQSLSWKSAQ